MLITVEKKIMVLLIIIFCLLLVSILHDIGGCLSAIMPPSLPQLPSQPQNVASQPLLFGQYFLICLLGG